MIDLGLQLRSACGRRRVDVRKYDARAFVRGSRRDLARGMRCRRCRRDVDVDRSMRVMRCMRICDVRGMRFRNVRGVRRGGLEDFGSGSVRRMRFAKRSAGCVARVRFAKLSIRAVTCMRLAKLSAGCVARVRFAKLSICAVTCMRLPELTVTCVCDMRPTKLTIRFVTGMRLAKLSIGSVTCMRLARLSLSSVTGMRLAKLSIGSVTCMRLAELVVARTSSVRLTLAISSVRRMRVARLSIGSARRTRITMLTMRSMSRGRLAIRAGRSVVRVRLPGSPRLLCAADDRRCVVRAYCSARFALCARRTTDVRSAASLCTKRAPNVAEPEPRQGLRLGGTCRRRGRSRRSYFRLDRSVASRRRALGRRIRNHLHERLLANQPGRRRERTTIIIAIRSCPTRLLSHHSSIVANAVDNFYAERAAAGECSGVLRAISTCA
ncbi:MAG TPA: hypothetical protein VF516_03890 [Kofleriaceae bacterium]